MCWIGKQGRPAAERSQIEFPRTTIIEPGNQGGTNWYPPSYSPQTGLFYISTWENSGGRSGKGDPGPWAEGQRYTGNGAPVPCIKDGHVVAGSCGAPAPPGGRGRGRGGRALANYKTEDEGYGAIRAVDPQTGEKKWNFKMANYTESGVLSTAGGLVFGGGMDGTFVGLDASTGQVLWYANLGGPNASSPISYAVNGKQYIIGTGEGTMYAFALPN